MPPALANELIEGGMQYGRIGSFYERRLRIHAEANDGFCPGGGIAGIDDSAARSFGSVRPKSPAPAASRRLRRVKAWPWVNRSMMVLHGKGSVSVEHIKRR